jgi:hypothetical protein
MTEPWGQDPNQYGSSQPQEPDFYGSPQPQEPNFYGGPQPQEPNPYGAPQPQAPNPYGAPQPTDPTPYQTGWGQAPGQYGTPYAPLPTGAPPNNYLVWAILTTLFCCLPLGIPSIVFASQVNSKWTMGDYAGAQDSSTKAKQFAMWGAIIGGVGALLYLGLVIAGVVLDSPSYR